MAEHQHFQPSSITSLPPQTSTFPPIPHSENQEKAKNNMYNAQLVCQWNHCNKVFPNHTTLAIHLSEDHIGWKKGGYACDWNNCSRQGAKCHNRFALMMHLRIHTGEKPFECKAPNCGQTFSRMDALSRHKKAEHGEGIIENPIKPAYTTSIIPLLNTSITASGAADTTAVSTTTNNTATAHTTTTTIPTNATSTLTIIQNNKFTSQKAADTAAPASLSTVKRKRSSNNNGHPSNKRPATQSFPKQKNFNVFDAWAPKKGNQDNKLAEQTITTTATKKELIRGTAYSQYRLAKAQLQYILRENEMLQDEYETTQKKLKRMKTERRVLLDALMKREMEQERVIEEEEQEEQEEDEEEEQEEDDEDIQNEHLSSIKVA